MNYMPIIKLVYILMPATIVMAFYFAPRAEILGESSRILYFHVPIAWVSALAFIISGIVSIFYLRDRAGKYFQLDEKARNSAAIGFLFTVLALITGAIWSRISWGAFWNWDPRQTSIVMLLLIYIAYFSLSSALENNPSRGKILSSYLIFAMVTVPFLIFVVPRMFPSLHPDPILNPQRKIFLEDRMKITLLVSVISFTLLYFYIWSMENRLSALKHKIGEKQQ
jgi:heme exporter protein C